jgi:hypothetical protein
MSADVYILEGGVWKKVSDAYTYNGSAWDKISTVYYWNGSAWKESFTGGFVVSKTFSSGQTNNFNIAAEATAAGWDGTTIIIANLTIPNGAYLGSSSTSTYALETASMVAGSTVNLTINSGGFLVGRGGAGGGGAGQSITTLSTGSVGGPALNVINSINFNLTNNGTIGGGGGGGGGGNGGDDWYQNAGFQGGPGGGGAGFGTGGPATNNANQSHMASDPGGTGTHNAGGAGKQSLLLAGEYNNGSTGGTGGNGGLLGTGGNSGLNNGQGLNASLTYQSGSPGGAAGVAINGWSTITVITEGTISGAKNN